MDREDFARRQANPTKPDDGLRPLTADGARRMRRNARGLARALSPPAALFTSPFVRAVSTAAILLERAWPEGLTAVVADELRPDRHPAELLALLKSAVRKQGRLSTIAIVGHEPHLSLAAGWLMSTDERALFELKKGGACLLDFTAGLEAGRARLVWLATPKLLRGLG